jgi:hypothetical protein
MELMSVDLPPRQDYYRPTHARALRTAADHFERWSDRGATWAAALTVACLTLLGAPPVWQNGWVALVIPGLLVCFPVLCGSVWLGERAVRMRSEAEVLAREHQARYGRLGRGAGG